MSEIEEVQEQMKADMEAMKEKMATIMEAMMSIKRMMEVNVATVVALSTATEMDPTHLLGFDQVNHPTSDMVGQAGEAFESMNDPHFVQVQNKHSFPPYGLPPNYTPPDVARTPNENVDNFACIPSESQQTQFDHAHVSQPMGETHEASRDHNLVDSKPHLECAAEGQAFCIVPLPNSLKGPQFRPQLQPLHFAVGRVPPTVVERGKFDHIEERLRAIEGGRDYAFVDMAELCLVPDVIIPPKFKVPNFDKYKGTTCPKNHLKMYNRKMGAYSKNEKMLMHFFQESLTGAAVTWYANLEPSRVHSWKDLMVTFIRKYQYNSDMAPDRMQQQNLCKKEHESFKEYA